MTKGAYVTWVNGTTQTASSAYRLIHWTDINGVRHSEWVVADPRPKRIEKTCFVEVTDLL